MRNRSASSVEEATNSFAAIGPVISVACSNGGVQKVTPSPEASYSNLPDCLTGVGLNALLAGSR